MKKETQIPFSFPSHFPLGDERGSKKQRARAMLMARQAYRLTNNSSWVPQLAPYDTRRNKQISAFIHSSFSQSPGVALLLGWSHLPLRKKFRANTPPGGRQLKLRREQKQQAAERRACTEGNCAPLVLGNRAPLLQAHRVRPEAGGAGGR